MIDEPSILEMPFSATLEAEPKWVVNPRDPLMEARLVRELGIPVLVAAVLAQRGITDPAEADRFLNPSLDQLHDPRLLPDYEAAKDAILGARERSELIFVHGDYDVDGVTSTAIFHRFLTTIGCNVHSHVPHRMRDGYGVHSNAVAEAKAMGAKLFLTCDCGIGAHVPVDEARAAGMIVVLTDHHSIGDKLPNAHAVINPQRSDSKYPFSELSGAGVVFKFCEGLTKELGHKKENYYRGFLDLATLGTIADVMPLIGENRIIARFGLDRLTETKKVGLRALIRESGVLPDSNKRLTAYHVGWHLGPRLNAAGRIDDAATALQLLIEKDETKAQMLARKLETLNDERRGQTASILEAAEEMVRESGSDKRNVIIVGSPDWHPGIVGIVAGRLVSTFHRPSIVVSIDAGTGIAKGSARSIPNFHLANAIRAFPDLMQGGGHAMAAGCSFEISRIEEIREALDAHAAKTLTPEDFIVPMTADMDVEGFEVTMAAADGLAALEPFGCANPEPRFVARSVQLCQVKPTKNPAHAQLVMRHSEGVTFKGIAFSIGEQLVELGAGEVVDLIFKPEVNEYRGVRELQWQVRSFRKGASSGAM